MIKKILFTLILVISTNTIAKTYYVKGLGRFDLSGYAGYRYIYSSVNAFPAPKHTPELGLLLNWQIDKNFSIFTQFSYESVNPLDNALVYGFLEYKKKLNENWNFTFRGGLLRHQFGLFNDQRVNPRTRPGGIIESQSLYWTQLRRLLSSGYGISLETTYKDFTINYTVSKPTILDQKAEMKIWNITPFKSSELESNFGGAHWLNLHYHPHDKNWLIKSTYIYLNMGGFNNNNHIFTAGYEYIGSNYDVSIEGMMVKTSQVKWEDIDKNFGWGLYVRGDYDVNDWLSIRAGYSMYRPGRKTIFEIQKILGLQYAITHQDDIGVGLTLYKGNWELKTDVHWVMGGNMLPIKDWNTDKDLSNWWYTGFSLVYYWD